MPRGISDAGIHVFVDFFAIQSLLGSLKTSCVSWHSTLGLLNSQFHALHPPSRYSLHIPLAVFWIVFVAVAYGMGNCGHCSAMLSASKCSPARSCCLFAPPQRVFYLLFCLGVSCVHVLAGGPPLAAVGVPMLESVFFRCCPSLDCLDMVFLFVRVFACIACPSGRARYSGFDAHFLSVERFPLPLACCVLCDGLPGSNCLTSMPFERSLCTAALCS